MGYSTVLVALILSSCSAVVHSATSTISFTPDDKYLVKDESVNISCSAQTKQDLKGQYGNLLIQLKTSSGSTSTQDSESKDNKKNDLVRGKFGSEKVQRNGERYEIRHNMSVTPKKTGTLTAKCAGEELTRQVIEVRKILPVATEGFVRTNMTCAFILPYGLTSNDVSIIWEASRSGSGIVDINDSCETLKQPSDRNNVVCSTASLVPAGKIPTEEALLRLAGKYWCHLVRSTNPAELFARSSVEFNSKKIEVRKCQSTSGANCIAGSQCSFRCTVYGWPFKTCDVKFPPLADNNRVKIFCQYDLMGVDIILDPAAQADGGIYNISVSGTSKSEHSLTYNVRVKDKLAPLWPFIGIICEVLLLCAIIFFFEKRNKKRLGDDKDQKEPLNR